MFLILFLWAVFIALLIARFYVGDSVVLTVAVVCLFIFFDCAILSGYCESVYNRIAIQICSE